MAVYVTVLALYLTVPLCTGTVEFKVAYSVHTFFTVVRIPPLYEGMKEGTTVHVGTLYSTDARNASDA